MRQEAEASTGMPTANSTLRSPWLFFLLVYALSVPFWLLGAVTGIALLPGLPIAALMAMCPAIAALLLVYKVGRRTGVVALLGRSFDYARIQSKIWYLPAILLTPMVAVLSYGAIRWTGTPIPAARFSPLSAVLLFMVFFVAALGEELGWSGFAIDPLQKRWGALNASIVIGIVWAVFHYVPLAEAHRSVSWIAWWSLGTISLRTIIVWLYNNTGGSVFAATLLHAASNLSWQIFPIHGSYFDPRINAIIMVSVAAIVTVVWGPRTLSRARNTRH